MLKKNILSLVIFVFLISYVSADIVISEVVINNSITITIDFEDYGEYLYFYESGSNVPIHSINLGCEGNICHGKKSFDYFIDSDIFDVGPYELFVYSLDDNDWFSYMFEVTYTDTTCTDADGDGYYAEDGCGILIDCEDNDANINPGATEVCDDNKDNDCDGNIDELDPECSPSSCSVDARECTGLDFPYVMYGFVTYEDVWDGTQFTEQKVCKILLQGCIENCVGTTWSFEQSECAILNEIQTCPEGWHCYDMNSRFYISENCVWDGYEECPFGCVDGDCLDTTEPPINATCTDGICMTQDYECPNGCENGKCIRQSRFAKFINSIRNIFRGRDERIEEEPLERGPYYRKGTCIDSEGNRIEDTCLDADTLREAYCSPSDDCDYPSKKETYMSWFKTNGVNVMGTGIDKVSDQNICKVYHLFGILEKLGIYIKPDYLDFKDEWGGYVYLVDARGDRLGMSYSVSDDPTVHEFGHFIGYDKGKTGLRGCPSDWTFTSESSNPEDFISGYNNACTEDFAEVFRFFLLHGPEFEERVVSRSASVLGKSVLEKKYNYMKDKIFQGNTFSCSLIKDCETKESPINATCVDGDGGRNYYLEGTTTLGSASSTDYCIGGSLIEYYCEENEIKSETYVCADGCEEGACEVSIGKCEGTTNECSTFLDENPCNSQDGCSWEDRKCEGTPNSCSEYERRAQCRRYGCTWRRIGRGLRFWSGECIGNPNPCSDYNNKQIRCENQGCSFEEAYCYGKCTECDKFYTESDCSSQQGCSWYYPENTKDLTKYSDKEVFLISSRDWRAVLPLVPVTTWTENENVSKYPTLIFYEEIKEDCNNEVDDNGNGLVDCDDPDCESYLLCYEPEVCDDGLDNDQDGATDCRDSDCRYECVCYECDCTDGIDNDNDGLTDCRDWDCSNNPACYESDCDDGIDNDNDGLTDCDDPDCYHDSACYEYECDDGIDNDGDGDTDCEDWDCYWNQACYEYECDDGIDNDGDVLVDCDDPDCRDDEACKEHDCDDGIDNDNDGLTDCDDTDCRRAHTCQNVGCSNASYYGNVDDPAVSGSIESFGYDWWSFDWNGLSEKVMVSLCNSNYDTYLDVWSGDCSELLARGDDSMVCRLQSLISLENLEEGSYNVKVYGFSSSSGNYILNITTESIPAEILEEDLVFSEVSKGKIKYASTEGIIESETYKPTFEPINNKNLIRVNVENKDIRSLLRFDVTSSSKNYIDIVAEQREIQEINSMGYEIEILPINSFDFFKESYAGLQYHTYESMKTELESIETNYPDIAKLYDIGDSIEGRDILAMKISDNVAQEEGEQEILVVGNHHAREIMTVEIPMYEINYILSHYNDDQEIKEMVDNWELWFVPMVNPDGHVMVEEGDIFWRKNMRDNGDGTYGVDLNRNYGFTWGYDDIGSSPYPYSESYRGTSAFSEPETQAIRDLVLEHEFEYVLDYHSYGEYILYPWGHIYDETDEEDEFKSLAQQFKPFIPTYAAGQISHVMYFANGDSIDWHYGEQTEKNKIFGFGFEVNTWQDGGFRPPATLIKPTSKRHLMLLANLTGYSILLESGGLSFDADSIIYFMQQYSPDRVTIIGETPQELDDLLIAEPELGAGLNLDKIQRISVNDYLSYWESYKDVVYVEDNYELTLLASTYASLINAPLIIKDTSLDSDDVFTDRNVTCVGDVDRTCNENYNLKQLQQKYVNETNTDKIILVNPDDLDISHTEEFYPERSAGSISKLYTKTSLSSPFLAGAKHELIIESLNSNYAEVDTLIENKVIDLGVNASYLTIIASPDAISMYDSDGGEPDFRVYADLDDNDENQSELAVGRIMGITISDVSSLIARTLFYDEIKPETTGFLMIQRGDPPSQRIPRDTKGTGFCKAYFDVECEELFTYKDYFDSYDYCNETSTGYSIECDDKKTELVEQLYDSTFAMFADHGGPNQWVHIISSDELENLPPLFGYSFACATCAYRYEKPNLFCTNMIRKGAIGYIGGNDNIYGHHFLDEFLEEAFDNNKTIGEAFKTGKNKERIQDWDIPVLPGYEYLNSEYGINDVLIGDPTFNGENLK